MSDAYSAFLHRAAEVERALNGSVLFGDDFTPEEIARWYSDEAEAYADLGARNREKYSYVYHALNWQHGFRYLPPGPIQAVLGYGSAYGDELEPILDRAESLTVVEPSDAFHGRTVRGRPATFVKPRPDGCLEIDSASIDLVTCFGVLHHIPNVSFVLREFARVVRPGGVLLIREPIVSMGDWRAPRTGLTPHERGIPRPLLEAAIDRAGFVAEHSTLCDFALTPRIFRGVRSDPYNSQLIVRVDAALARWTSGLVRYHATSAWAKLRPCSVFVVARRA